MHRDPSCVFDHPLPRMRFYSHPVVVLLQSIFLSVICRIIHHLQVHSHVCCCVFDYKQNIDESPASNPSYSGMEERKEGDGSNSANHSDSSASSNWNTIPYSYTDPNISICPLCELPLTGLTTMCMMCGHGGHEDHIRQYYEYFKKNSLPYKCPVPGCTCMCCKI